METHREELETASRSIKSMRNIKPEFRAKTDDDRSQEPVSTTQQCGSATASKAMVCPAARGQQVRDSLDGTFISATAQ